MSDTVKIDAKISRRNVLLLHAVIERGLTVKDPNESSLLSIVSAEVLAELTAFADDCLQKAGLTDLREKLKAFSGKQA